MHKHNKNNFFSDCSTRKSCLGLNNYVMYVLILLFVSLSFVFDSEGQSAAIPVASMEFAAICLRNALLLLPEHQQQDPKAEPGSKSSSQPGSGENSSENNDISRYLFCLFHHVVHN